MGALLMPPPNKDGPEVTTPRGRPDDSLPTNTDTDRITAATRRGRRNLPKAYASLFAPDGRRMLWLLTFICPHCKFGHRALADTEEKARALRPRGGCGRRVAISVARTYRGRHV